MIFRLAVLAVVLGASGTGFAQGPEASSAFAPAQLPGKGLAQHDFLYAGESHDRKIFIVRQGKIVWSYDDPAGKGVDAVRPIRDDIKARVQTLLADLIPRGSVISG